MPIDKIDEHSIQSRILRLRSRQVDRLPLRRINLMVTSSTDNLVTYGPGHIEFELRIGYDVLNGEDILNPRLSGR